MLLRMLLYMLLLSFHVTLTCRAWLLCRWLLL